MNNKAVVVICSTPYSKRINEKCFLKINGLTVLEHIAERIKSVELPVILAIPQISYSHQHYQIYAHIAKE